MSSNWVIADTNLTQKISPDSDDLVCNISYAAYDMLHVSMCLKHINKIMSFYVAKLDINIFL